MKKPLLITCIIAIFALTVIVGLFLFNGGFTFIPANNGEGNKVNPDQDQDGMLDSFEQVVGMPTDVYNGRYAIVVNDGETQTSGTNLIDFLINGEKFEPDHVIGCLEENATRVNLVNAISKVSEQATENATVIISFCIESSDVGIGLRDGFMTYKELDSYIDNIKPQRMLITLFGCGGEAPIEPISKGHSQRVVSNLPLEWLYSFSHNYPNTGNFPTALTMDKDSNNFISFEEILNTCAEVRALTDGNKPIAMSDIDDIASSLYLGDFSVNDPSARD